MSTQDTGQVGGRVYVHSGRILRMAQDARDRAFANEARDPQNPIAFHNDAIVAVILSAASTEAFINELGEMLVLTSRSPLLPAEPLRSSLISLGTVLSEVEESNGSVALKYHLASRFLSGVPFDKGAQPFQDFVVLHKLRNAMMHAKGLDSVSLDDAGRQVSTPPRFVLEMQRRGLARKAYFKSGESWFDLVQTTKVAEWACDTAMKMITAVLEQVPTQQGQIVDPTAIFKSVFRHLANPLDSKMLSLSVNARPV